MWDLLLGLLGTQLVADDKEAWYMAWIRVVPPSPGHLLGRCEVCYEEGRRRDREPEYP